MALELDGEAKGNLSDESDVMDSVGVTGAKTTPLYHLFSLFNKSTRSQL